jgi:hypothetical protein
MKSLIIEAELINPPTESGAFRTLTLLTKMRLSMDNVVQVEQNVKDFYYRYMKNFGLYDFIDAFVTPQEVENGILMSYKEYGKYHNYVITDRVTFDNLIRLVGQIELASY